MVRYVRGVLRRRLGRPVEEEEAEDVVQDYLLQAVEKGWLSRDGEDIRCFRAYLQTQLVRFATSHVRKTTADKRSPGGTEPAEVLDRVPGSTTDVTDELDRGWVDAVVVQVLGRLLATNLTYHDVVVDLLETDGRGSDDLQERLGRTGSRLKDLRHRARRRFAVLFYEELRLAVRDDEAYEELCERLGPYLP